MKKFFASMLIALAVVVGQIAFPTSCAAVDSYVGSFRVSQAKGYIMTETIRKTGYTTYEAGLKAVFPNGTVQHIYYFFDSADDTGVYFRNSDGISGHINPSRTPVEYNMWRYIINYFR